GEKTATTLITEFGTVEDIYKTLKKNPEKIKAAGIKDGMFKKLEEGEEDAEFSKMLATIRRDAPIDFELPKTEWKEGMDEKKLLDMLAEFEFRSLIPRVKELLSPVAPKKTSDSSSRSKASGVRESSAEDSLSSRSVDLESPLQSSSFETEEAEGLFAAPKEEVDPEEFAETALAVSVLDSNIAKPELEDIYRAGRANKFEEAK